MTRKLTQGMALTEGGTLLVSADNVSLYAYRTD
jgi:hypothetical protein